MSDLERLKQLLLGEERERLEALERGDRRLPIRLPRIIEQADARDPARLNRALERPFTAALAGAVRRDRQVIVDALFPVIGPAIRKAIAEALRNLVADINRALESSFTARGLRWRVESWRTGVPYPQVVIKHTVRWRIDHLFLIERDSGLVLHHESAADVADLDSDAIAGMLTAIGEFVKDSVGRGTGGALESARVGEHGLWVLDGPRASLAAFIRGVPPQGMRLILQRRLEDVHARLADPAAALSDRTAEPGAAMGALLAVAAIDREAHALDEAPATARSRTPLLIAASVVALALLGWLVRDWIWAQRMHRLEARLREWPGLHLETLQSRAFDNVRIAGLLDPLADPLLPALNAGEFDGVAFDLALRGYISTDDAIIARRAQAVLAPPDGATLAVSEGELTLGGSAGASWLESALARAAMVPGVVAVRSEAMDPRPILAERIGLPDGVTLAFAGGVLAPQGVAPLAWVGRLRDEAAQLPVVQRVDLSGVTLAEADALQALRSELSTMQVDFVTGSTDATDDGTEMLGRLMPELRRAFDLAGALGIHFRVRTFGLTDASGDADANASLRARRAQWLSAELAREFPELDVAPGDDAARLVRYATLDRRAALLELDEIAPQP